ncbi:MAG: sigma 54-interacting transcriptional regulator [Pseudomonadota bacterium]|nr:sigma 54-interacting transcriptional regulator [Pseudomonadota bacterium]
MTEFANEISLKKEDFDLLYEISTSISAIHNLDEMLRDVLLKIKDAFHIDGASIALHDHLQKEFYFIQTVEEQINDSLKHSNDMRFSDSYGVAGWVFKSQESVLIEDVSQDKRFTNELDIQKNMATHSMICVPLKSRRRLLGILYVLNDQAGSLTEKTLRLLEILSSTIAVAIENAQLYGDLQLHAKTLESENIHLKTKQQDHFNKQGIIGSSVALQRVFTLMSKVVTTTTSVLIQGETGTGKELIAKAIHYNGILKNKPFMAENCAALSENLLESELFGHVKGAFTGAVSEKKGLFELANGGTVFLDEIADMPVAMQSKLLRVLQERQVRPVGGSTYRQVDFRFISAANRDLFEEVKKGNFREDLFYRIQAFPIVLPPLRERKEDIILLASHFLKKYAAKFNRPVVRLTPGTLNILMQHVWPGNIRELEHEIERALTLADESEDITAAYLSERVRGVHYPADQELESSSSLPDAVTRLERQMIIDALGQTGGNRSRAARLIGLTRQGLLNKINRYKIESRR